jgi:predicted Rossmann-fold nucleotide-binding protein
LKNKFLWLFNKTNNIFFFHKAEREKEKEDLEEQLIEERRINSDNEELISFLKDELEVTKVSVA